jgi:hypothetical protein
VTSTAATTETPAYMVRKEITQAVARKAAEAGITTDVYRDGLGRYHVLGKTPNGSVLIEKQGSAWRVHSPISAGYAPKSLAVALKVAADLIDREAEMTARAKALTDAEIAHTLANRAGVEYHYLQRVIGERCHREYEAAKVA